MAVTVNVACNVSVYVDTGVDSALELWCESENGISIREQVFQEPIHSDSNGGQAGPPVDILVLGQTDIITFTSVRFDSVVDDKVKYVRGLAQGVSPSGCVLLAADSKTYRILLKGTNFTRNYLRVVVSERSLDRIGSHASVRQITLTCYKKVIDVSGTDTPVLWNTSTTGLPS